MKFFNILDNKYYLDPFMIHNEDIHSTVKGIFDSNYLIDYSESEGNWLIPVLNYDLLVKSREGLSLFYFNNRESFGYKIVVTDPKTRLESEYYFLVALSSCYLKSIFFNFKKIRIKKSDIELCKNYKVEDLYLVDSLLKICNNLGIKE